MLNHYVYILASQKNGTLYIGNTIDLKRRVYEHKSKMVEGFTKKYNVHTLVYFEHFEDRWAAADRERKLKNWKRQWKIDLIEGSNSAWSDLYDDL